MRRTFLFFYATHMTKTKVAEPIKNLGLRLPLSLHAALVAKAQDDRRSLKDEIIVLLEKALGIDKKK